MNSDLISLQEAASEGIERVRLPRWADPLSHLKIDIVDGRVGPWVNLYCPFNLECNGKDPVTTLGIGSVDVKEWIPYEGVLPDSKEYREEQARYEGVLGKGAGESS